MARAPFAIALAFLLAAFRASAPAERLPPFSDYEAILRRKPFGDFAKAAPPPAPDAAAAAEQERKDRQALARQIDLVAVTLTPRGDVAIGLVDKTAKPARSLFLGVGETEGGYTVVGADVEAETAVVEKDGTTITLKLGRGLVETQDEPSAEAPAEPSAEPSAEAPAEPPAVRGIRPPADGAAAPSYRERLRLRRLEKTAETERLRAELRTIAETTSKEAADRREREINLELVSRGEQPLSPIELTPEEDAELVRKGVLPQEEPQ